MSIPSKKSPALEKFIDQETMRIFGRKRTDSIRKNICVVCGRNGSHFKNKKARVEYTISGLCQLCQNETFGE